LDGSVDYLLMREHVKALESKVGAMASTLKDMFQFHREPSQGNGDHPLNRKNGYIT
jgi:hypothetical protein